MNGAMADFESWRAGVFAAADYIERYGVTGSIESGELRDAVAGMSEIPDPWPAPDGWEPRERASWLSPPFG